MAITRVQGNKRGIAGNSSSLSLTLDSTPLNENLLIAVIGTYGSYAPYVSSMSQSGVTWTRQVESHGDSLYGRRVEIWAGVVSSGASTKQSILVIAAAAQILIQLSLTFVSTADWKRVIFSTEPSRRNLESHKNLETGYTATTTTSRVMDRRNIQRMQSRQWRSMSHRQTIYSIRRAGNMVVKQNLT
jgi:hypothetical protein